MKVAAVPPRHRQRQMWKTVCLQLSMVCVSAICPPSAEAQTAAAAPLPPVAQEALNKGIIAAKVPDYLLAVRFFEEARKVAPQAPVIFLNLGLAESRIGGRELRAIAWFGTYLAAYPDAPNAAAVKEQIAALDVRSQSNLFRLIKAVQDAAISDQQNRVSNLSGVPVLLAKAGDISAALRIAERLDGGVYTSSAFGEVSQVQAEAGNVEGAQKTANLISELGYKSGAQTNIALVQIKNGDLAGAGRTLIAALKTAGQIENNDRSRGEAIWRITSAQAKAGDIAGAQMTAALVQYEYYRIPAWASVAQAQIARGDTAGAKKTLDIAFGIASLMKDANDRSIGLAAIADAQIAGGDIAGARITLASALKNVDLIEGTVAAFSKARAWSDIAEAQAKSGDIAGAQKTVDRIPADSQFFNQPMAAIAEAQARAGDSAGAQKTANRIQDPFAKGEAQQRIASAQNKQAGAKASNPGQQVAEWLGILDDSNPSNDCPLNTEPFLDLAGYLKSQPPADAPWKAFRSSNQTARSMAWAQHVVAGMLRKQTRR